MFNISKLNEFSHSIIYGFEPESTIERISGNQTFQSALIPECKQYQEVLNAYLFAQNTILPLLKSKKGEINEEIFLSWIMTLHGMMGKTILKENFNEKSGNFTKRSVQIWQSDTTVNQVLIYYYSGLIPFKKDKEVIDHLVDSVNLNREEITDFINILNRINKNKDIKIHPSQEQFVFSSDKRLLPGIILLNKLQTAYLSEVLSPEEKVKVDKIVRICMWPDNIPKAMRQFAKNTLDQLKECSPQNLDQVSEFLGSLFYGFTDIHPFGNANGRVALCLVNIFLRYFELPSVMLRQPNDDKNKNSDYFQAIQQINLTRTPLIQLIKKRILDAQQGDYKNEKLFTLVKLRITLAEKLSLILLKNPSYDLESLHNEVNYNDSLTKMPNEDAQCIVLDQLITAAHKKAEALNKPNLVSLSILNGLNNNQKEQLKAGLASLSGVNNWKVYSKNGVMAWIELNDKSKASEIAEKLKKANVAKITCSHIKDNDKIWVVKCDEIQFNKIFNSVSQTPSNSSLRV